MTVERIYSPEEFYPLTEGPAGRNYHQIAIAEGQRQVYIAGTVAKNDEGKLVGVGDMATQVKKTAENLGKSLEAAGAEPADVVRADFYTPEVEDYLTEGHHHFVEFLGEENVPPGSILGVTRLADTFAEVAEGEPEDIEPRYLIEIDMIAVVDE